MLACIHGYSIGLTFVLVHVAVYELNDIRTDGGSENSGEGSGGSLVSTEGEYGKDGTGSHFSNLGESKGVVGLSAFLRCGPVFLYFV